MCTARIGKSGVQERAVNTHLIATIHGWTDTHTQNNKARGNWRSLFFPWSHFIGPADAKNKIKDKIENNCTSCPAMAVLRLKHSALKAVIQNYIQINKRIELFLNKKKIQVSLVNVLAGQHPPLCKVITCFCFLLFSRKTLTHSLTHRIMRTASSLVHCQFSFPYTDIYHY